MATNPKPTTPTGQKPEAETKDYRKFLSADVLAAGGGFAEDLKAAAADRATAASKRYSTTTA